MGSLRLYFTKAYLFLSERNSISRGEADDSDSKLEDYFIPENKQEDVLVRNSPDNKYKLVIERYKTTSGGWNYSRGLVYKGKELIADVKRNYSCFEYAWILGHQNGHDYLLAGEDYQGMTCIELDTGKRVDYLPKAAENGAGFCWVEAIPNPSKNRLAINGCHWACPYEWRIVDFSNPMLMPYAVLNVKFEINEFIEWKSDTEILMGDEEIRVRVSDEKDISDFDEEDRKWLEALTDEEYDKLTAKRILNQQIWSLPPISKILDEYAEWLDHARKHSAGKDVEDMIKNLIIDLPKFEQLAIYRKHNFL